MMMIDDNSDDDDYGGNDDDDDGDDDNHMRILIKFLTNIYCLFHLYQSFHSSIYLSMISI